MTSLWDRVKADVPSNAGSIVESSIRAIGELPGASEDWDPGTIRWPTLVTWGFPLTRFPNPSASGRFKVEMAESIVKTGRPGDKSFAELGPATLMWFLGTLVHHEFLKALHELPIGASIGTMSSLN